MKVTTPLPQINRPDTPQNARPVKFGNEYSYDPVEPDAGKILAFEEPRPIPVLQKLGSQLNRFLDLRGLTVNLSPVDLAKLKALPENCGNIMVAPHPDDKDGSVMIEVARRAGRTPAGFFMANDAIQKKPKFVRTFLNRMGAIPITRGKSNPQAINWLRDRIAEGGWGNIFPEGSIYYSREVMPMEYGAVKVALEAALKAEEKEGGARTLPIFITPFSHVYFHKDQKALEAKLLTALTEIQDNLGIPAEKRTGSLREQFRHASATILKKRAEEYRIDLDPAAPDLYEQGNRFATALLENLEKRYLGEKSEGFHRRRAFKVRAEIYKKLSDKTLTEAQRQTLKKDIKKTEDIVTLITFKREYLDMFGDLEMWGEFIRRFRDSLGLSTGPYGPREVIVKTLEPVDVRGWLPAFRQLQDEDARKQFMFDRTEELRQTIQQGVLQICAEKNLGRHL